jgi:next-to-BRCA1 protein 1
VLGKILQMILSTNTGNENDSGEVHKVQCDACDTNPIESDRYKCLNCEDLNFCASCFESRRESSKHKSGHAFLHFKSPGELFGRTVTESEISYSKLKQTYANDVHESITCDGCNSDSIKGLRFKCDSCPNYDLCQRCVDRGITTKTHKSSHPLIVVPRRAIQQIPAEDIKLGEEIGSGAFGTHNKNPLSY